MNVKTFREVQAGLNWPELCQLVATDNTTMPCGCVVREFPHGFLHHEPMTAINPCDIHKHADFLVLLALTRKGA